MEQFHAGGERIVTALLVVVIMESQTVMSMRQRVNHHK